MDAPERQVDPALVSARAPWPAWVGLGLWNLYFLPKLALAWAGYLDFHVLPNLVFAVALLLPWRYWVRGARAQRRVARVRTPVAVIVGIMLLVHDTWFPPVTRLLRQPGVLKFTPDYLLELVARLVDLKLVGVLFIAVVALWFASQWLRLTTFTLLGLGWMGLAAMLPAVAQRSAPSALAAAGVPASASASALPPASDAVLDDRLQRFYAAEAPRRTTFKPLPAGAAPFDVLILQICSMDWDDLTMVGQRDNPLFQRMDVVFDHFNSATTYSGPASIRLLRASCGQTPNAALYQPAGEGCLLFDNLRRLGFLSETQMNNDDDFDGYLDEVRQQGMPALSIPERGFKFAPTQQTFSGHPLWDDGQVLDAWWRQRLAQPAQRVALFYDTISLHDGNREILPGGGTEPAAYAPRAQRLLGDLNGFVTTLEHSGRKVLLVILAEHGDNLRGDRMQIPGMRDIPSPTISHVPAMVKLIGFGPDANAAPRHVTAPSSYLALSDLIARLAAQPSLAAADGFKWKPMLAGLPTLGAWVSANGGVTVMQYGDAPWVRYKDQGPWQKYPR